MIAMVEITATVWIGFILFILALLALDLIVFHRKSHEESLKEALIWSAVWISIALAFNYVVYHYFGKDKGLEFLTGYLIEKALSVDNLFVFIMLFSMFGVAPKYQHKVLFGALSGRWPCEPSSSSPELHSLTASIGSSMFLVLS